MPIKVNNFQGKSGKKIATKEYSGLILTVKNGLNSKTYLVKWHLESIIRKLVSSMLVTKHVEIN